MRLGLVLAAGLLVGASVTLAVQDRSAAGDAPRRADLVDGPAAPVEGLVADVTGGPPTQQVLLAWTTDPLPADLTPTVAAIPGVERATAVRHATVGLVGAVISGGPASAPAPGAEIPIDTIAVDPTGYPAFVPPDLAGAFATLGPDDAILGRTGAQLRDAAVGDRLELAAGAGSDAEPVTVTVTTIVDDAVIGGAELALATSVGDALGMGAERYLLVAHHGDRASIEDQVRALVAAPVRFRGPGETPYLRDGDAVLPQALVKASFGEFAIERSNGVSFVQEQSWEDENLVDADVAVLGRVRCHRAVVEDLRAAMGQIERDNLAYLIDPTPSSVACWYLDTIERTGSLSRGAWGVAVVLNAAKNPTGSTSVQDPRVVAILQAHGFTWGGDFLIPEPAYFEHVGTSMAAGG